MTEPLTGSQFEPISGFITTIPCDLASMDISAFQIMIRNLSGYQYLHAMCAKGWSNQEKQNLDFVGWTSLNIATNQIASGFRISRFDKFLETLKKKLST